MNFIRMFSGDDGETHFEDLDIDFTPRSMGRELAAVVANCLELGGIRGGRLQVNPPGLDTDFHCEPQRQLVIYLTGSREMISGTGESRIVGPGDIMLAENSTGRGHRTKAVSEPQQFLLLYLSPDVTTDQLFGL